MEATKSMIIFLIVKIRKKNQNHIKYLLSHGPPPILRKYQKVKGRCVLSSCSTPGALPHTAGAPGIGFGGSTVSRMKRQAGQVIEDQDGTLGVWTEHV